MPGHEVKPTIEAVKQWKGPNRLHVASLLAIPFAKHVLAIGARTHTHTHLSAGLRLLATRVAF